MKFGVTVPGVRFVDLEHGLLGLEWIEGISVRQILGGGAEGEEEDPSFNKGGTEELLEIDVDTAMQKFGLTQGMMF